MLLLTLVVLFLFAVHHNRYLLLLLAIVLLVLLVFAGVLVRRLSTIRMFLHVLQRASMAKDLADTSELECVRILQQPSLLGYLMSGLTRG